MTALLTMPEAAGKMRKSERWLVEWLRAHPVDGNGIPYCRRAGRTRLFPEEDILRITIAITGKSGFDQVADLLEGNDPLVEGDVYFVAAGDFIKIGHTRSPLGRIKMLRTNSPHALEILHYEPGTRTDERVFHERFAAIRVRGEWFRKTPELLEFIETRKRIRAGEA